MFIHYELNFLFATFDLNNHNIISKQKFKQNKIRTNVKFHRTC